MTSGEANELTGQLWHARAIVSEAHFGCAFVVVLWASWCLAFLELKLDVARFGPFSSCGEGVSCEIALPARS